MLRFPKLKKSSFVHRLLAAYNLCYRTFYDGARFFRFGPVFLPGDLRQAVASMMFSCHCVEKGLALRSTRPAFGRQNVNDLCGFLRDTMNEKDPAVMHQWMSAREVLCAYVNWHKQLKDLSRDIQEYLAELDEFLSKYKKPNSYCGEDVQGGNKEVSRDTLLREAEGKFEQLVHARRSIRHFDVSEPVKDEDLHTAIRLAQYSPSSCNRQSAHVYIIKSKDMISEILGLQSGAHGFSDDVTVLLVITGDIRVYGTTAERNLVYVDTSLFAMSLLYALSYRGIGACPLHWCVSPKTDRSLRKMIDMHAAHVPSMLIAVGSLPESFSVAHSERLPLESVITTIK